MLKEVRDKSFEDIRLKREKIADFVDSFNKIAEARLKLKGVKHNWVAYRGSEHCYEADISLEKLGMMGGMKANLNLEYVEDDDAFYFLENDMNRNKLTDKENDTFFRLLPEIEPILKEMKQNILVRK